MLPFGDRVGGTCSHLVGISLTIVRHSAPCPFLSAEKGAGGWGASKSKTLKLGFPASKPTSPGKWLAHRANWHKCPAQLSRSPSPTEGQVAQPHRRLKFHAPRGPLSTYVFLPFHVCFFSCFLVPSEKGEKRHLGVKLCFCSFCF